LHKMAVGKAFNVGLLDKKRKSDDPEKLPASLRKFQVLKAAVEKEEHRKRARLESKIIQTKEDTPVQDSSITTADPVAAAEADQLPPTSSEEKSKKPVDSQKPSEDKKAKLDKNDKGADKLVASVFEKFNVKKLKNRKKEYLKAKAEKKRNKGSREDNLMVSKELELQMKSKLEAAKFGEVADAPLKINLKRKHWASAQKKEENKIHPQQVSKSQDPNAPPTLTRLGKTEGQRCSEIFKKQMAQAQQQITKAQRQQKSTPLMAGKVIKKQNAKASALSEREKVAAETMRLQVIEAYRKKRMEKFGNGGEAGLASATSLAALVRKNKATPQSDLAEVSGQGGGNEGGRRPRKKDRIY